MMPRTGDVITIYPFGQGTVHRLIGEARIEVVLDRIIKDPKGSPTNVVIAELHPTWCVVGVK